MPVLLIARALAVGLSVITFGFLFLHDSWSSDNQFLVPDLILCAGLILAAALPASRAVPALLGMFMYSAGVFSVSVASYAVDGELGLPSLLGVAGSVVIAALLGASSPVVAEERLPVDA